MDNTITDHEDEDIIISNSPKPYTLDLIRGGRGGHTYKQNSTTLLSSLHG
jgi:hypothetical protein